MNYYLRTKIFLIFSVVATQLLSGQSDSLFKALKHSQGNEKVDILNTMSLKYLDSSLDSSLMFAQKAYSLAKKRNYTIGKVTALKQIGNYNMYQNKYSIALSYYDSALYLIKDKKEHLSMMTTLINNKGVVYDMMGSYSKALSLYNEALKIRREINDKEGIAQNLHNIGCIYYLKGDYNVSIDYLLQSLKIEEEIGNVDGVGQTYVTIASIYSELGEHELSKKYLQLALTIFEENNSIHVIPVLLNLGIYHMESDSNLVKSEEYLNRALEESHKFNEQARLPEIYYHLCKINYINKDYKKAEEYINKSLIQTKESGERRQYAIDCKLMGDVQLAKGNSKSALYYFESSLSICNELGLKKEAAFTYEALAELSYLKKDYKSAYNYIQDYAQLKDSVFSEEKHRQVAEMQTKYDVEKKENELVLLSKENEVQRLENKQLKTIYFSLIVLLTLSLFLLVLLIQRNKLKANNQSLVLEQRLLRLQMNPHFIFNSITAIQNFVLKNNPLEAGSYLSGFANLMRNILYQSRTEFVSLDKEIEMLNDYLRLQKLRLDNGLEYSINVDDTIETDITAVPPLLLQPFIENAVEHGLLKKEKPEGKVDIRIYLNNEDIVFEVEDNGIGRQASSEKKVAEHHSVAMDIVNNRIILLGKTYRKTPDFKIIDLTDDKGQACGTKIILKLPSKYL